VIGIGIEIGTVIVIAIVIAIGIAIGIEIATGTVTGIGIGMGIKIATGIEIGIGVIDIVQEGMMTVEAAGQGFMSGVCLDM